MKKEILFYWNVMQHGRAKGKVSTFDQKIKYIARNILYYPWTKQIASFLQSHPYLSHEIYRYPVLCSKIHRPYMTHNFSMQKKVDSILASYQYIDNFFQEDSLTKLYRNGRIKILQIKGKDDITIDAYLKLYSQYEKEGEFNLVLYWGEILLATLTFSIVDGRLFIGGLQGLGREYTDPEILKKVTKSFYGMFPKRLVLEIFYSLFSEKKIAVGNRSHIYLAARYKHQEKRKIHADYDEFWQSLGANPFGEDLWALPEKLVRKEIEEIPSKKRSQYRNRYAILDEIHQLVLEFLKQESKKIVI
ncbi:MULTISPECIES: VirK/YbjX family protein [Fusobacterium]|uniref:DUF535 domain-containing protein n=1 Tax=Fusobacterium equinum TaxID=134605 RepID=A0A133NB25_9FUSO|nr:MULTISPECIES: DUF535 family protein [Fusobacterium]AVQ16704.1 DUF535 domain-containing protein [Fusobacterium gonidiaformans ATCC 25563]EFS28278.1 hypothetical protein FGAG_00599 [Fusobacterium gonidiaformans ATCC 25563]KXA13479.1 hypothetical protein HMPREF3206_01381 [Fusobacterium equinum]